MADKTIPQTAPIGLPAKHYYTLQDVADRWKEKTGRKVEIDDVLHFEDIGELTITGVYVTVIDYGEMEELPATALKDLTRVAAQLRAYGFVKHFIDGDHIDEAVINKHAGSLVSVIKYNGRRLSMPEQEIHIPVNALCVSLEEIQRFEEAHNIGKPMQLPKPQEESEDTKAARLERALGALALGLAKDATKWRNGDAPNVSKLTAVALDAIKANEDGSRKHGYGESSMRETISAAIKTVQKDQATR